MHGHVTATMSVSETGVMASYMVFAGEKGGKTVNTLYENVRINDVTDIPPDQWELWITMSVRVLARWFEDRLMEKIVAGEVKPVEDIGEAIQAYRVSERGESI